jgi:hypothetical protein
MFLTEVSYVHGIMDGEVMIHRQRTKEGNCMDSFVQFNII